MNKSIIIILFSIVTLTGCKYQLEDVEAPDNLIPRDTFTLVLKDIMVLEAYVKTQKNNVHDFFRIMPESANLIFEDYGIDSSRYISSMNYYSKQQQVLAEIYNEIQDEVVLESAELQEDK
jgi:hypothetical protein